MGRVWIVLVLLCLLNGALVEAVPGEHIIHDIRIGSIAMCQYVLPAWRTKLAKPPNGRL